MSKLTQKMKRADDLSEWEAAAIKEIESLEAERITGLKWINREREEERERCIAEAYAWWSMNKNFAGTLTTDEAAKSIRSALEKRP